MVRILLFILVINNLTISAQNWKQLNFVTNNTIVEDIAVDADTTIYVAENSYSNPMPNRVSKSTDLGNSWTVLGTFPKAITIRSIALDEMGALYAAIWDSDSSRAEILVYKDSAAGFQPQLHDPGARFISQIKFVNGVGYGIGFRCPLSAGCTSSVPVLYKKVAGNTQWRPFPLPLNTLSGLEVLDSNKLYVWNSDSALYSADGGHNWIARTIPLQITGDFMGQFYMQNDSLGYCAINNRNLYRTTDSAKSWNLIDSLSINGLITVIESYEDFVIIGTSANGEIAYIRNIGAPWTTDVLFPSGFIQAISATQAGIFVGQFSSLHYHNSQIYTGRTGFRELSDFQKRIYLFPNPASEMLYINSSSIENYSIFTMGGECVLKGEASDNGINISTLSKGLYIFKAENIDGVVGLARFSIE